MSHCCGGYRPVPAWAARTETTLDDADSGLAGARHQAPADPRRFPHRTQRFPVAGETAESSTVACHWLP